MSGRHRQLVHPCRHGLIYGVFLSTVVSLCRSSTSRRSGHGSPVTQTQHMHGCYRMVSRTYGNSSRREHLAWADGIGYANLRCLPQMIALPRAGMQSRALWRDWRDRSPGLDVAALEQAYTWIPPLPSAVSSTGAHDGTWRKPSRGTCAHRIVRANPRASNAAPTPGISLCGNPGELGEAATRMPWTRCVSVLGYRYRAPAAGVTRIAPAPWSLTSPCP
jgi:hypothetical protein